MMSRYVVDANVALKWFMIEDHSEAAIRIRNGRHALHVPSFFLLEFGHVVCKKIRRKELGRADGFEFVDALRRLPIRSHPDRAIFPGAFDVSISAGASLYDSMYIALALELDCEVVTADRRLIRGIRNTRYADYVLWVEDLPVA